MAEVTEDIAKYIDEMKAFAADFVFFRGELIKYLREQEPKMPAYPEEHIVALWDSFKKDRRTDAINSRDNKKENAMASTAQIDYIRSLYVKKEGGEDKVAGFLKSLEKPSLTEKDADGKDVKMLISSSEASTLITELKALPDKRRAGSRGY